MANFQDIFNLAKADGGKFFVMDETGEPKLVIMDIEEYQTLLLGKIKRGVEDVEAINKEILKAQLEEVAAETVTPSGPSIKQNVQTKNGQIDMREEVIDPSFDFEGPKLDLEDLWDITYWTRIKTQIKRWKSLGTHPAIFLKQSAG